MAVASVRHRADNDILNLLFGFLMLGNVSQNQTDPVKETKCQGKQTFFHSSKIRLKLENSL